MDNLENNYDHNFKGKWCVCNDVYDPEQFMIICLGCTDYYHLYHMNLTENERAIICEDPTFSRMICLNCLKSGYKYLRGFSDIQLNQHLAVVVKEMETMQKKKVFQKKLEQ